jgi:pimeloyl-ACP methyl ester carboxylesterase
MPHAPGAGGNRIHYRVVGSQGPWVVLIHGLGLSGRFWFSVPDGLAADPAGARRVLVVDNRGTGTSDCPSRPWTIMDMADDVAAVLEHAKADRAVVVGLSMGGMIAQHTALRHAGRVSGLVLMSTSPGLPHGKLPDLKTMSQLVSLPFRKEPEAGRILARLMLPESEFGRAAEHFAGWREALIEEGAPPRCFFFQIGAVATHSTGFQLAKIGCPTVVMAGAQDVLVPPVNAQVLAERIPQATLEMLPGAAHAIDMMDKDAVRRAVNRLV